MANFKQELFFIYLVKDIYFCRMKFSVVIIAKNEAHIIGRALASVAAITDDIVVVDSGSTDETINICRKAGVRIIETAWLGYGAVKNLGNAAAKHDWILSLDADEALDDTLKKELANVEPGPEHRVFKMKRKSFFCDKPIRYGVWGGDSCVRLFNKQAVKWDASEVHEDLLYPPGVTILVLKGNLLHYTVNSLEDYTNKTISYAKLSALKYFQKGKTAGFHKIYLAPVFSFFRYYVLRLGFLDGFEGYLICRTYSWYTFMKYVFLREMNRRKGATTQ